MHTEYRSRVIPDSLDIAARAEVWRRHGAGVVAVQGLGFVGAAVAAALASARDDEGRPRWFVIGVDLPTEAGLAKIARINAGEPPFTSPDPELGRLTHEGACEVGNLVATDTPEAYRLADIVVVDVHLDVHDRTETNAHSIDVGADAFERAIRAVARFIRPDTLVLVETTVPVGTTERIVIPAIRDEFRRRGLDAEPRVAHCYERVMPGPRYVESIRRFWRVFSATSPEASADARAFLSSFIDTEAFPLREVGSPTASELAKVLENSYRAANIAFIHEWTLLAEKIGVNLWEVVDSIRLRQGTHDNMRYPGLGVGGYCLTKDSLLAQWSARALFGLSHELSVTLRALEINLAMPLHTVTRLEETTGSLLGKRVAVLGVAYLADVGDTRNSPTEVLYDGLRQRGAEVVLHDPTLDVWDERPEAEMRSELAAALARADAVVLAVPHTVYRQGMAETLTALPAAVVVDCQNLLDDAAANRLVSHGWRVVGIGKGHWRALGYGGER